MTSYGKVETEKLIENLELQLNRLVTQLDDIESSKDDMDESEYNETKEDTIEQLKEFHERLDKLVKGDISLVTKLGAIRLVNQATQAAISQAFRTPEVIRLFGRREPKLLRDKLVSLEQECKLGKINSNAADQQKMEILTALRQLGEQLSANDLQFLEKHRETFKEFKNIEFIQVQEDDL